MIASHPPVLLGGCLEMEPMGSKPDRPWTRTSDLLGIGYWMGPPDPDLDAWPVAAPKPFQPIHDEMNRFEPSPEDAVMTVAIENHERRMREAQSRGRVMPACRRCRRRCDSIDDAGLCWECQIVIAIRCTGTIA